MCNSCEQENVQASQRQPGCVGTHDVLTIMEAMVTRDSSIANSSMVHCDSNVAVGIHILSLHARNDDKRLATTRLHNLLHQLHGQLARAWEGAAQCEYIHTFAGGDAAATAASTAALTYASRLDHAFAIRALLEQVLVPRR